MKHKRLLFAGAAVLASVSVAAVVLGSTKKPPAQDDPRTEPPLVKIAEAMRAGAAQRGFTGSIAARVQSNLGFRVAGKIVQRLVDVGQQVKAGQPLMQIDAADLRLALTAKRNAIVSARSAVALAKADERRYASLVESATVSRQRYEQAKNTLDAAEAQLATAEAEARVAENETTYTILAADADGTVVETLGDPGQVVSAGQIVVRLAHAGPREAVVFLPETIRPAIGEQAEAGLYGKGEQRWTARLRQLSDAADSQTRTFEARYVLDGAAASAPLGATVTVWVADAGNATEVKVPVGAILDDGARTGVWLIDHGLSIVRFKPVIIHRLSEETAVVSGINVGDPIVALGAHLLQDGASIRTAVAEKAGRS